MNKSKLSATNHLGWVIEEFILPEGWKHSELYPEVYCSYYQALEAYSKIYDTEQFRVYEAVREKN